MRRSLVLTSEHAGHAFRRTLPASALELTAEEMAGPPSRHWFAAEEVSLFLLSFTAFFLAISAFIF